MIPIFQGFALNQNIKMIKVKRIGASGSTPTYYLEPSKSQIEKNY